MGSPGNIYTSANLAAQTTPLAPVNLASSTTTSGPSFKDVLDTINPLQHIPILSGLYRSATGQTISPGAKLLGDTIYGIALGGTGLLNIATTVGSSIADTTVQEVSGTDIGGHIMSAISGNTSSNSSSLPTPTPLVPTTNPSDVAAAVQQAITPSSAPLSTLFPNDQNPLMTSAQYKHAQAMDSLNKQLMNMNSHKLMSHYKGTPTATINA